MSILKSQKIYRVLSYLRYWLNAVEDHSLHSPFIYDLFRNVINVEYPHQGFIKIEHIKTSLLNDHRKIEITDYGAGSSANDSNTREISDIARHSLTKPKLSRLLFRLIMQSESKKIVELGTSFGINTLYMNEAGNDLQITTFEGCPNTADVAERVFKRAGADNIKMYKGNIDKTLPDRLGFMGKLDFIYVDANHRYEPTLRYFNLLAKKTHDDTLMVLADIHWSAEMEAAWKEIVKSQITTVTIDLYDAGLVYFKPDLNKQHFILEFSPALPGK